MSAPVHPGALGSSPLTATTMDAGGNPLFAATARHALAPLDAVRELLESIPFDLDVVDALLALEVAR